MHRGSSITYASPRNRKKWQLKICSTFERATMTFSSSSIPVFAINFTADNGHSLNIRGLSNQQTIAASTFNSTNSLFCLNLLYGRGTFVLLQRPEGDSPADTTLPFPITLPRDIAFTFTSHTQSNLTELCLGDFLGTSLPPIPDSHAWDTHVHDFL